METAIVIPKKWLRLPYLYEIRLPWKMYTQRGGRIELDEIRDERSAHI